LEHLFFVLVDGDIRWTSKSNAGYAFSNVGLSYGCHEEVTIFDVVRESIGWDRGNGFDKKWAPLERGATSLWERGIRTKN
jgi:hypothetical protein